MSVFCISPWNPTLQIFLNLVACFANLILMTSLEWLLIVLKFVSMFCRPQRCKDGVCSCFCEASCHTPTSKRGTRRLWIARGGFQPLLLYRGIFLQFYPCVLKIVHMRAILSFFSCDRSHGFFSHITQIIAILWYTAWISSQVPCGLQEPLRREIQIGFEKLVRG